MKVYLSGPLDGQTDEQIHSWRDRVQNTLSPLGYEFTNTTLRIWNRLQDQESCDYIVESDLHEIDLCDIIIVHTNKHSIGTAIECHYAWERSKIVIVVMTDGFDHAWLRYYSDVCFEHIQDAIDLLGYGAQHGLNKEQLKYIIQRGL